MKYLTFDHSYQSDSIHPRARISSTASVVNANCVKVMKAGAPRW